MQRPQDFVDERLGFANLADDEVPSALLRDLDKCIASHVLYTCTWGKNQAQTERWKHTFVRLVHKLEELVDDSLEELPMRFEEARILANDVHDIRGNDGFVILAALNLTQPKEILDDDDEEALLVVLICDARSANGPEIEKIIRTHRARYRTNGPAERVEVVP